MKTYAIFEKYSTQKRFKRVKGGYISAGSVPEAMAFFESLSWWRWGKKSFGTKAGTMSSENDHRHVRFVEEEV